MLLKTAVARVANSENGDVATNARIILDDGSQKSYIQRSVSERLKLKPLESNDVVVKGICGRTTVMKSETVELYIETESKTWIKIRAGILDEICEPINQPSTRCAVRRYPHLANIKFADYHNGRDVDIQILIGGDYYYDLVASGRTVRGPPSSPTAVHTELGWTLGGPVAVEGVRTTHSNLATISSLQASQSAPESDAASSSTDDDNDDFLQRFWDLDTVGIRVDETPVSERFLDDIRYDAQKPEYEVRLPRKSNIQDLPSNYNNAAQRLYRELNKLKRDTDPDALRKYHEVITDQLNANKIEKCDAISTEGVHYLPHRGVKKETSETTKLRVVYDASSKSKGAPSLNDCLFKGPSLTPHLFDVLLLFRLFPVAFVCDIQKAFLQIRVAEPDRDFIRFLWFEDPFAPDPVVVAYRFAYVPFGLNCSPFLLNGTLRHHLMKYNDSFPAEIEKIIRLLYVDDFTGGADTAEESGRLFHLFKRVLQEGGFSVHKFTTNDQQCSNLVDSDQNVTSEGVSPKSSVTKVLGVSWDKNTDKIVIEFELEIFEEEGPTTKRHIARVVMKIFDPLGLIAPVVLAAKLLLQEAWGLKSDWDSPLPDDLQNRWKDWCESLKTTEKFEIPRCYVFEKAVEYHLIGFSDASFKAYAAVVYLRATYHTGTRSCAIVASKTRVTPSRISTNTACDGNTTIPRLELLSCCILSTLMCTVSSALEHDITISKKLFWTDSTISLHRIRNVQAEYKPFVENRLAQIRLKSETSAWFYIPTDINPADLPSRGCLPHELVGNRLWSNGPEFLSDRSFDDYAMFERNMQTSGVRGEDPEQKRATVSGENVLATTEERAVGVNLHNLFNLEHFNDLERLLRITAYVVRFASKNRCDGELQSYELENARKLWIISEQARDSLVNKEEFVKTKANLRIFQDGEGVMRCQGRLANSELPYDTKHPIYIPARSQLAILLVLEAHDNVFHQKERSTLTEVRTNYWIPRCRKLVRRLLPKCWLCNRMESHALTLPTAPPLPKYRLEISPPFSNVGYDHMGPLWVYDVYGKGGTAHKAYISLITCCTTRMLHLELQPSLGAAVCIRGLKRTFSRVGYPKRLVSDNHKTFRSQEVRRFATSKSIEWKYILELSPHWGGFYERLNRMIKSALRKILWKSKLTYEEVETILTEIEGVLNCRPLCYVDDSDLAEPITPSHLMYGRNIQRRAILNGPSEESEVTPTARIVHVRKLQTHFWKRFSGEYITALRERDSVRRKGVENPSANLKVGDVVMIYQKHVARCEWPLGKVIRLVTSDDGHVRGAELQTATGTLKRPVSQLHPLEMS